MQRGTPVTNVAQRPADALLHEVPIVGGASLDDREELQESGLGRRLVVSGQARHHHEPGAPLKLALLPGPRRHHFPRQRRSIEQCETGGVGGAPVIEVAAPGVHLRKGQLLWIPEERRQDSRVERSGLPELHCQLVILPNLFRARAQGPDGNPVGVGGRQSIARQSRRSFRRAGPLEPHEHFLNGRRRRGHAGHCILVRIPYVIVRTVRPLRRYLFACRSIPSPTARQRGVAVRAETRYAERAR